MRACHATKYFYQFIYCAVLWHGIDSTTKNTQSYTCKRNIFPGFKIFFKVFAENPLFFQVFSIFHVCRDFPGLVGTLPSSTKYCPPSKWNKYLFCTKNCTFNFIMFSFIFLRPQALGLPTQQTWTQNLFQKRDPKSVRQSFEHNATGFAPVQSHKNNNHEVFVSFVTIVFLSLTVGMTKHTRTTLQNNNHNQPAIQFFGVEAVKIAQFLNNSKFNKYIWEIPATTVWAYSCFVALNILKRFYTSVFLQLQLSFVFVASEKERCQHILPNISWWRGFPL